MKCHCPTKRTAFNLVELLTVLGILGILLGLLLPAVQQAREAAARQKCLNNLKQIGIALHNYEVIYGRLPPQNISPGVATDPNRQLSWMALILPQMDQSPLWNQSVKACQTGASPLENPPHAGLAAVISSYVCPDDGRLLTPLTNEWGLTAAYTSYIGISSGSQFEDHILPGVFFSSPGIPLIHITDGTSSTIMVGERPPPNSLQAGLWYPTWVPSPPLFPGPNGTMPASGISYFGDRECSGVGSTAFGPGRLDNPCDRLHLWSLHPGGGNFLLADGSSRFLSYSAGDILNALASIQGGEVVELPD